jgi:PAS domain S-box-containing protein
VSDTSGPLRGADGKIIGVIATVRDITERKKAEVALAEEVARRRILFEQSPDGIVILDPKTMQFLEFNAAAHEHLGYSGEEFSRLTIADLDAAETPGQTKARIAGVLSGKRADFETVHRTRDGKTRNVLVTAQAIDVIGRPVYLCVWRDVTERKELEQKFLQAQKMEAIGQLAGGVAHDFRNQLTVIKGYGEMLLRRSWVKREGVEKVQQILKAADRSTLLTSHLLAFSRKQTLQLEQVDMTDLITDISKALPRLIGEDVRMSISPCPRPCRVEIDPGQFQQAIINLATNARDAMPKGGDLTIATSLQELDHGIHKRHPEAKPGVYAAVAVTDTGCGMDDRILARIFEPFFTTKEVGQGTGLGLAMVYGFVAQSGGVIEVESQPGKGTTFTLFFPEYKGSDKTRKGGSYTGSVFHDGTETILVIEDEKPVRQMLVESLRELGYEVLSAGNAAEAAAEIERAGSKIDMLITDVVMPGGSGVDLVQTLQKARPEMPVLYVSGYAEKELRRRGVTIGGGRLLTKPFSSQTLAETMRKILGPPKRP